MDQRQRVLLYLAIAYAQANIGDLRDAFGVFDDDDPVNEAGLIEIRFDGAKAASGGFKHNSPESYEFAALAKELLGVTLT